MVAPGELAAAQVFSTFPDAALAQLAESAKRRSWAAGQLLFSEGDEAESFHVVVEGELEVFHPAGAAPVLETVTDGQSAGELGALEARRRTASLRAVRPTVTIEVDAATLRSLLDSEPSATRALAGALTRSLTLAKEEIRLHNVTLEQRVHERTEELRDTQLEIIRRLAAAAELRDDDTGQHILRMSTMCGRLARATGDDAVTAEALEHAAQMHDVGKLGIPDAVLLKPGKLDDDEWVVMRSHTTIGAGLLSGSRSELVQLAQRIALAHHERWDGTGYPSGIAGDEIPREARICAICDVFDALTSERPYKQAWSIDDALAEIGRSAGSHFDPALVPAFLALVADGPATIEHDPDATLESNVRELLTRARSTARA